MLQFLQPIWLAAMAGIAIPVILHLWNDRQGKVLAIGSIAFLEKRSPRRAWSRRVSEWWLLVLRCLLLIVLALLLAGPSWRRTDAVVEKGWVLVDSVVAQQGNGFVYKTMIDSLVKEGYERHVMEGNNYWEAYRAADREAPVGAAFAVVTTGWVSRFSGERPFTDRSVRWYTYVPADSISHWTHAAWLTPSDSIRVLEGNSGPTGTLYKTRLLPKDSLSSVRVEGSVAGVDTTTLRITIYATPEYMHDSRYWAAAVRALGQFSQRKMRIDIAGTRPMGGRPDWLFWLSSEPLPAGVAAKNILRYETGKTVVVDSWLQGEAGVEVGKEIEKYDAGEYAAVWKDGYGRMLLGREGMKDETKEGIKPGTIYHFYSRLDPAWNGLAESRSFPVLLGRLLLEEPGVEMDRRVLDPAQIVPVKTGGVGSKAVASSLDLGPVCWVLLFLLFILERVVAFTTVPYKRSF